LPTATARLSTDGRPRCTRVRSDSSSETLWSALPSAGIPFTFLTAYLPGGGGWWWLLRAVSIVGVLVVSFIAASGVDYHDSWNSGLLGAPFYSLTIGLLLLVPLTILVAVLIWKRSHGRRS